MMRKILIVDDQPDIRRLIHLTLGKRYEIHEASNAADALLLAAEQKPDAVILDVMMPGDLNGMDVLQRIRADAELKGTFVVMVTAKGQQADFESAIDAGADGYLIKPFSPLQLMSLLQEHFGS
jgi:CheY-like chemotaxis protein